MTEQHTKTQTQPETQQQFALQPRLRPSPLALTVVACAVNLSWALSYPVSKLVMAELPPLALTCWRLLVGGVLLAIFVRRRDLPRSLGRSDAGLLAVMAILGCALATVLQYVGTSLTLAVNVSLLVGLEPVVLMVLAALLLGERAAAPAWWSVPVAMAGVALITVEPGSLDLLASRYLLGNVMVLASVVGYACYTVAVKRLSPQWSATAATAVPFLLSAIVLVPAYAILDPRGFSRGEHVTPREALGVAYISLIATTFGYWGWNWLLRWVSATRLSFSLYLQPVAGAAFSWWLLDESLTPSYFLGATLVITAIAMGQWRRAMPARGDLVP